MQLTFLWIALILAFIDWSAVYAGWKQVEYLAKPGVMVALFLWIWSFSGFEGRLVWVGLAVLCSLAGDVFLMLPKERFIAGLISFLIAHLAYILALNDGPPPLTAASLVILLLAGSTSLQIFRRVLSGLESSGKTRLKTPVMVYMGVILVMLLSALGTLIRDEWDPFAALLVSAGAMLFFISDTLLAWDRFVEPLSHARLRVIIPYHLGQIGLVAGAVLQALVSSQ